MSKVIKAIIIVAIAAASIGYLNASVTACEQAAPNKVQAFKCSM